MILNNITFEEYIKIINKNNKAHSENAYALDSIQEYSHEPKFLNTILSFNRFGIDFEIKEQIIDKMDNDYFKYDNEQKEYYRDKNNNLIKLTYEEKKQLIKEENRFEYNYAIYNKENGEIVARTQDEWGCLLVKRKNKYRGFGFGEDLVFLYRKKNPLKQSGGFTPSGYRNIESVFRRIVLENEKNGIYNDLTESRKKEILESVKNFKTFEERNIQKIKNVNYNMNNNDDFLYIIKERFILIYNKKLINLIKEKDFDQYDEKYESLLKSGILGYMSLYGNSESNRIYNFYGKNDKIKKTMLNFFSLFNKIKEFEVYKENIEDFNCFSDKLVSGRDFFKLKISLDHNYENKLKLLNYIENKIRKSFDPYDEIINIIHETAEFGICENKNKKSIKKIKI